MRSRLFVVWTLLTYLTAASLALGAVDAVLPELPTAPSSMTTAVDNNGVRHGGSDYREKVIPWLSDRVKAVAPEYPLQRDSGTAKGLVSFASRSI